jgi:hypothetical protein
VAETALPSGTSTVDRRHARRRSQPRFIPPFINSSAARRNGATEFQVRGFRAYLVCTHCHRRRMKVSSAAGEAHGAGVHGHEFRVAANTACRTRRMESQSSGELGSGVFNERARWSRSVRRSRSSASSARTNALRRRSRGGMDVLLGRPLDLEDELLVADSRRPQLPERLWSPSVAIQRPPGFNERLLWRNESFPTASRMTS